MALKMVFKQQRSQRPMHSKVMTDKHMPHMTDLASFIPVFCTSGLYARIFNFDFLQLPFNICFGFYVPM